MRNSPILPFAHSPIQRVHILRRWVPWITGSVIIVALVWAFIYLQATHPFGRLETKLGEDKLPGIGIEFVDAEFVGRQRGEKAWTLKTKIVDVSRDRQFVTFRGATRGSLVKGGQPAVSLSAGKVVYNTLTRNLSVPGTARLQVSEGPVLAVKNIYWNGRKSKLVCTGGIRASFDGSTVEGDSMVADLGKKELSIRKVRGTILVPEE